MKWGRRKAKSIMRPTGRRRGASQTSRLEQGTNDTEVKNAKKDKIKKAAIIGTAAVGTALAAYGAYKYSKYIKTTAGKKDCRRRQSKSR